jgi:hypothetical protein
MVTVLGTPKVSTLEDRTRKSGTTRLLIPVLGAVLLLPAGARADDGFQISAPRNPYAKLFASGEVLAPASAMAPQSPAPVLQPVEYSPGYKMRLKIHKVSSFAMLPLFATELILGQSLYDGNGGGSKKDAHAAVGVAIGTLFGINTVTGVWNLWEGRKDPHGRTRRIIHSVLMLAADAGFTVTAALAPESEHGNVQDDRAAHRTAAITSIGLGTAGYLLMLFGK